MNFTWINKQGVKSDSEIFIQRTGRFEMECRYVDRAIQIAVETGFGERGRTLFFRSADFDSWPGQDEERELIISAFKGAIFFMGAVPVDESETI